MKTALRVIIGLMGVLFIFVGFGFLTDPTQMGPDFGVLPDGNRGLSTIRSDFTAFFWVSGGAFVIGAWKQNGMLLLVTSALMGIVLAARGLSLALDGTYEGWYEPMAVEAIAVILALIGAKVLRPEASE
ncbi:MAG: DUF4345 family protein [Pseudomonadota bacterium]